MASDDVVEFISRRIEVRCFVDNKTNVGVGWMSSGQVWIRKMQRFEETKCCVVDGRDHVLKGLAVFGVTHDCVHLRRWGTKEV